MLEILNRTQLKFSGEQEELNNSRSAIFLFPFFKKKKIFEIDTFPHFDIIFFFSFSDAQPLLKNFPFGETR